MVPPNIFIVFEAKIKKSHIFCKSSRSGNDLQKICENQNLIKILVYNNMREYNCQAILKNNSLSHLGIIQVLKQKTLTGQQ